MFYKQLTSSSNCEKHREAEGVSTVTLLTVSNLLLQLIFLNISIARAQCKLSQFASTSMFSAAGDANKICPVPKILVGSLRHTFSQQSIHVSITPEALQHFQLPTNMQ